MICSAIIFYILLARSLSENAEDRNLLNKPLSHSIIADAVKIAIKNATVELEDKTILYYLEAKSLPKVKYYGNLLYLHGAAYSSRDWNRSEPSIMQLSAAAGYRTIAIDLPGFSQSWTKSPISGDRSTFMSATVKGLNIHKPIIISPSASGSYSVPYVLNNPNKIAAFVPVAPCCVYSDGWENFTVPTLIIYGSEDKASISRELLKIPNKNLVIIPDAPHAAYIKKPMDFVTALINFLYSLRPS
uniref:AB hydrolase-1 domain-containing protein n=1 Tax=Elaeophora elaphi TaxID=1147741 RepID=A0A0R3RLA2_9BILA